MSELDPEDAKLVTLARSIRARVGAAEGAAVRDRDGRTYAAATVALPSLTLTALQVAVAMAASSGALGLEAAAIVGAAADGPAVDDSGTGGPGTGGPDAGSMAVVRDLGGADVPVVVASPDGSVRATVRT